MNNYEIEYYTDHFHLLNHLKLISICRCGFEEYDEFHLFCEHFKDVIELEELYLDGIIIINVYYLDDELTDKHIELLCINCYYLSHLKKLGLHRNEITSSSVNIMSLSLRNCSELSELGLNGNKIYNKEECKREIKSNHPNNELFISI